MKRFIPLGNRYGTVEFDLTHEEPEPECGFEGSIDIINVRVTEYDNRPRTEANEQFYASTLDVLAERHLTANLDEIVSSEAETTSQY